MIHFALGLTLGLLWSNFIEYAYHRWAMHWPSLWPRAAETHVSHHSDPSDPSHITMGFWYWAIIFIINIIPFALLIPSYILGIATGFILYIVLGIEIHLRIHNGRWIPESWRTHHLYHHRYPRRAFNIFLPIFDRLLRT